MKTPEKMQAKKFTWNRSDITGLRFGRLLAIYTFQHKEKLQSASN